MRCSLSVQAAGPRRRRSVSRRDRSGGTRPLRRFHERSHRASPAVSSWSQLSPSASPLGSPAQPGHQGAPHPLSLFPAGPTGGPGGPGEPGGPGGPAPRGWTLVGPHRRSPRPPQVPPYRRLRGRPPRAGGAGRTGGAMRTSVPSLAGCWRPPPCHPPGLQRAPRATPGVPALPRAGGSGTDFRMAPSAAGSKGRLASRTVCGASVRPGAAASRARVALRARDSGWHRAARLLATTFARVWSRFGGPVCYSTAGRGRLAASGTLWSGPPAGALGRRGAPLPATPPASPPGRCPSA